MRICKVLLSLLPLSICFLWSAHASAYSVSTSLTYNVGTDLLTGYSETDLGYYDIYEDQYCSATSYYEWSDGYYVEVCVQQVIDDFSYAGVSASQYAPYGLTFADYQAGPYTAVSIFPTLSHPDSGAWNAVGDHYYYEDIYQCDLLEYGWPGEPPMWSCYYMWSFENYLTTSVANENVTCNATVTSMIAEYTTFNVVYNGVPFRPICSDFSSSGNSTYFTWNELNGGFTGGNPNNPWGMVKSRLKTLADDTRSGWGHPLVMDSGYRSPLGNSHTPHHAPDSRHMQGTAVDIHATGTWNDSVWNLLATVAEIAGATYIEPIRLSNTHVHEDVR